MRGHKPLAFEEGRRLPRILGPPCLACIALFDIERKLIVVVGIVLTAALPNSGLGRDEVPPQRAIVEQVKVTTLFGRIAGLLGLSSPPLSLHLGPKVRSNERRLVVLEP